jgi:hypothetical protein
MPQTKENGFKAICLNAYQKAIPSKRNFTIKTLITRTDKNGPGFLSFLFLISKPNAHHAITKKLMPANEPTASPFVIDLSSDMKEPKTKTNDINTDKKKFLLECPGP